MLNFFLSKVYIFILYI